MQNEQSKMQQFRQSVRAAVCIALFIAFVVALGSCGRKPASEHKDGSVNMEEIKAKIMEKDIQPSAEALARRGKSIAWLKQKNIPTIQHLPVIEDSQSAKMRTKEAVARRAIALCIVAVKGEGLEQAIVQDLVKQYSAQNYFTPAEKKFIENTSPGEQTRVQFVWRYESYWVMLWALGYVETLDQPDKVCDVQKAVKFLQSKTAEEFMANAKLRDISAILDEADLIYRYDWALVNARVKKSAPPSGLNGDVVMERHHALNWLIGYMDQEWDDVTTDT